MKASILIGNLPVDTTEENLLRWLGETDSDITISVQRNEAGKCRGFATIEIASEQTANHILDTFDRTRFENRIVFMHLQQKASPVLSLVDRIKQFMHRNPHPKPR